MRRTDVIFYGQVAIGSLSVGVAWALALFGHPWLSIPFAVFAGASSGALMSGWGWRR